MVERLEIELRKRALGADDGVETFVRANRRAVPRNVWHTHQQCSQERLLFAKIVLDLAGPRAGFLGLAPQLGLLLESRVLEAPADCVALRPQSLDFGLQRAHVAVEREEIADIDRDILDLHRALDRVAIGLDEIHSQHGGPPARKSPVRQAGAHPPP